MLSPQVTCFAFTAASFASRRAASAFAAVRPDLPRHRACIFIAASRRAASSFAAVRPDLPRHRACIFIAARAAASRALAL